MKSLEERYKARIALFDADEKWLRSRARSVNLNKEYEQMWAVNLGTIMDRFIDVKRCLGMSSNNIAWNKTEVPLRVMRVPHPVYEKLVTIVNPEVEEMSKKNFESVEGCAAFPGKGFYVKRSCYVKLSGISIKNYEFKPVELEYGINGNSKLSDKDDILESAWVVQHELDHLEGILLKDRAFYTFDVKD